MGAIRNVIPYEMQWEVQGSKLSKTGAEHLRGQGQMEHCPLKNIWADCSLLDNNLNS